MLKVTDIFQRPEGQQLDLTGQVDLLDFFNAGIAAPANQLEEDLNIESKVKVEENAAIKDFERANQEEAQSFLDAEVPERNDFGFQESSEPIVGDFSADTDTPDSGGGDSDTPISGGGDSDFASFTFNREARRDSQGRLSVFKPPSGDGGGSFEVAGITAKFQPKESKRLKNLIESGRHQQAEKEAKAFFAKRAEPFFKHTNNKGIQLQLADTVHHRGEGGLRGILQRATGSKSKSHKELITNLSNRPDALERFHKARQSYELEVVDRGRASRKKFRKGLQNRFNAAFKASKQII